VPASVEGDIDENEHRSYLTADQVWMANGYIWPVDNFWDKDQGRWIIKNKIRLLPFNHIGFVLSVGSDKHRKHIQCYCYGAVARFIARYVRPGDFAAVIGYLDHRRIELDSWNGHKRMRDWYRIIAYSIKLIPMVKKSKKAISIHRTVPWRNPNDFSVTPEKFVGVPSLPLVLSDTPEIMKEYLDAPQIVLKDSHGQPFANSLSVEGG
jgi:hypothetical protein